MIKDELEAMLTEELSLAEIARRLNVNPTSVINYLYDMHELGQLEIMLGPDKEIRYKLK